MTKLYQALTYFWQMDMMVHLFCLDYFWSTFISIGQKPVLLFRLFRFYSMWFVAALGQLILRRQMDIWGKNQILSVVSFSISYACWFYTLTPEFHPWVVRALCGLRGGRMSFQLHKSHPITPIRIEPKSYPYFYYFTIILGKWVIWELCINQNNQMFSFLFELLPPMLRLKKTLSILAISMCYILFIFLRKKSKLLMTLVTIYGNQVFCYKPGEVEFSAFMMELWFRPIYLSQGNVSWSWSRRLWQLA